MVELISKIEVMGRTFYVYRDRSSYFALTRKGKQIARDNFYARLVEKIGHCSLDSRPWQMRI